MGYLLRRRALMGRRTRLPGEYQEAEYLQSTGTQYIKTGVNLKDAQKIFVKTVFKITAGTSGNSAILCGNQGGGSYSQFKSPNWYNNLIEVRGYGISSNNATSFSSGVKETFTFDYKPGQQTLKKGDTTYLTASNQWQAGPNVQLFMFADNNNGSIRWQAKASIYNVYIVADDVVLRDFVPCYRLLDSKPGMYDLVNKVFYTNSGSGEFTLGPDV